MKKFGRPIKKIKEKKLSQRVDKNDDDDENNIDETTRNQIKRGNTTKNKRFCKGCKIGEREKQQKKIGE